MSAEKQSERRKKAGQFLVKNQRMWEPIFRFMQQFEIASINVALEGDLPSVEMYFVGEEHAEEDITVAAPDVDDEETDNATPLPHLNGMQLLPCREGVCPECAVDHPSAYPHNRDSMYYQYRFYGQHGRWPTWVDAMAHCPDDVRSAWTTELAKKGVTVAASEEGP